MGYCDYSKSFEVKSLAKYSKDNFHSLFIEAWPEAHLHRHWTRDTFWFFTNPVLG